MLLKICKDPYLQEYQRTAVFAPLFANQLLLAAETPCIFKKWVRKIANG